MKKANNDLIFSSLKVKKIIQENKEIGKIANMAPYVICTKNFINQILYSIIKYSIYYYSKILRIFY